MVENRFEGTGLETGRAKGGHEGPGKGWHGPSRDSSKEAAEGIARRNIKEATYVQPVLSFGKQLERSEISSFTDREDRGILPRDEESIGNSECFWGREETGWKRFSSVFQFLCF